MTRPLRVLSVYEGFFAGGARILHTDVIAGLHAGGGQSHSVLSIAAEANRESTIQPMTDDPRYRLLIEVGVEVMSLGRTAGAAPPERTSFTDLELRIAADAVNEADVILSLKEQPLGLLLALQDRAMMPDIPVAVCLHRSDPTHSGPALGWLAEADATGLLTSTISCAESTSEAYRRAAALTTDRHIISNGIDTARFRPSRDGEAERTRHRLGIPADAPVVVFAARFDPMKNPGLFLRSVAMHAERPPNTHYVLCGAGMDDENPAFRSLLRETGVRADTHVHPLGIRNDMPTIYQIADIVALTSSFGEASPLCLLEGAACGATPVTTSVGDSARSVAGIGIVTTHDAHDIATAWDAVIQRRDAFRAVALAARPRLDRERMVNEYRSALEILTREERAAA